MTWPVVGGEVDREKSLGTSAHETKEENREEDGSAIMHLINSGPFAPFSLTLARTHTRAHLSYTLVGCLFLVFL